MAEPERVEVDHILIGVTSPKFAGKRAAAEAKKVAYELLAKLKAGGDWAKTKRVYSEDPPPGGPYALSNRGTKPGKGEYARDAMVPAFGNVGFTLAVGEIGVADHDAKTSPFGYHLIKRTK